MSVIHLLLLVALLLVPAVIVMVVLLVVRACRNDNVALPQPPEPLPPPQDKME
jgi:hypothetical protein